MVEILVLGEPNGFWNDVVDEFVDGVVLEEVQHLSRGSIAVSDVAVDELVRLLQVFWDLVVLHDLDLLFKDLVGDEHLVVHLESSHLHGRGGRPEGVEGKGGGLLLQDHLGEHGVVLGVLQHGLLSSASSSLKHWMVRDEI